MNLFFAYDRYRTFIITFGKSAIITKKGLQLQAFFI